MIQFENVTKIYDNGFHALNDISFTIEKGEFVFLVGSSAAGKSTIIKLIMKEEDATSGNILINGIDVCDLKRREVPYFRRTIGVVFQDFRLLPHKTVQENVAYAMEIIGAPNKEIRRNVPGVLSMVGLSHKAKMYPSQLSGGEQQRVAIARALVNEPAILLADEPTGNLDENNSWDIMKLLEEANEAGTTVIVVTHNMDIVRNMKRRTIRINDGVVTHDVKEGGMIYEV